MTVLQSKQLSKRISASSNQGFMFFLRLLQQLNQEKNQLAPIKTLLRVNIRYLSNFYLIESPSSHPSWLVKFLLTQLVSLFRESQYNLR